MDRAGRARLRRAATLLGGFVVCVSLVGGPVVAQSVSRSVPKGATSAPVSSRKPPRTCSAGHVALTFDDGPSRTQTPRLVHLLLDRHVPATFFMVGSRIGGAADAGRLVARSGFVIGNHTWSHPQMPSLSDKQIRKELVDTGLAFRKAHIPHSQLMRPPYGAENARVLADIARLHLVPVLWTVDSRDWVGGNSQQIADRILAQLRPHRRNVVLQHDGINNSPASVAAVPIVIRKARQRGYCFADLDEAGRMRFRAASTAPSAEADGGAQAVRLLLSAFDAPSRAATDRRQATGSASSAAPSPTRSAGPAGSRTDGPVRVSAFDPWYDLR